MGSTTTNLIEKRNNPDYLNFIAVGDAMRTLAKGLRHYTEYKTKELHAQLLGSLSGVPCNCPCTPGVKPCRHICKWGKMLTKLHANKKKNRIPFYQSDSTKWHDPSSGYWEVAKVFMSDLGTKWCDVTDPGSTDLTGLLNLLIFCKHFNVQQGLLMSVRDLRNEWAHTPNHMLSKSQTQKAFSRIENLMNDAELISCKEVQDCRAAIEEVKNADVSIVQERDLLVLKEITRHEEFERERQTEMRREELMENTQSRSGFDNEIIYFVITGLIFTPFMHLVKFLKRFPWLLVLIVFISRVGDYSVFVSENGCSGRVEISPLHSFGFNEFDFIAHLSYKRENFFGRNWFFRELSEIFEDVDAPVGVLITGDPGSGKSALMAQLICSPFSNFAIYNNIIGYHICDFSERSTRDGASFVRNLVDQIASYIPEYADHLVRVKQLRTHLDKRCERDPTACFRTTVVGPLRNLKNQTGFKYIVIDALDECLEKDGETSTILDILRYKVASFPHWLKVIMSSRNGTTVTAKVPRTVRRMPLESDDERNIEDIRAYISRYLREKSSFISKLWKSIPQITNELVKNGDGNFLFVKTVLENNLENDGTINLFSLPNGLHDIYDLVFQRYYIKDSVHFEALFEILLAAGSLQEKEIFDIFKSEFHAKGKEVQRLLAHISSLLHYGRNGTVNIYHHSFAEWLTNHDHSVKGYSIEKRRGHAYFADFLIQRTMNTKNDTTFKQLSELCMHVLYSGGPSDKHKKQLELLNVSNIRNQQNGKCILHDLAQRENGSRVLEIFLPYFTSTDVLDLNRKPPAYYAAQGGFANNLKVFLNKKTCANCILNRLSAVDEIRDAMLMKRYKESSIMHVATYNGHVEVIDMLLKHNASFIKFNDNIPPLITVAAERGHLDILKLLYKNGADVDHTTLHHAAARNNFLVVKYLLETAGVKDKCLQCKPMKDFNLHQNTSFSDVHDMFCETALHAAVSKGHVNITRLLLQSGNSDVECKHHSGKTPLMDAVERNDTDMVKLLLENGANIEEKCGEEISLMLGEPQKNGFRHSYLKRSLYTFYREKTSCTCGNRALHLCAKYGLWHMAKYLINWNASVVEKNCKGETVWKIANVSHNEDFIYHVNRMLLNLDDKSVSTPLGMGKHHRRIFKKLLKKFSMKTKPYQSSFQCDSTVEGMSPLHIAALMGIDVLKRVYKKAHEIAPSLPLNCTNKHWITPSYLAYFYDSIHALTDEKQRLKLQTPRTSNAHTKTLLQYPDREVEFYLIYNYFYHVPDKVKYFQIYEILLTLGKYSIESCSGYDDIPTKEALEPSCDESSSDTESTRDTEDLPESATETTLQTWQSCQTVWKFVIVECDQDATSELEKMVFNEPEFTLSAEKIKELVQLEEYMLKCGCPTILGLFQKFFTKFPKQNRYVNQFISERMGWKDTSADGEILKQWPTYIFHKMLRNEYQSYKYLDILNEGFEIKRRRNGDKNELDD